MNLHQRLAAVGGSLQAGPDPDGGIHRARPYSHRNLAVDIHILGGELI